MRIIGLIYLHDVVGTGVGSAWNIAKVHKSSTVAVFGLGTIGLAVPDSINYFWITKSNQNMVHMFHIVTYYCFGKVFFSFSDWLSILNIYKSWSNYLIQGFEPVLFLFCFGWWDFAYFSTWKIMILTHSKDFCEKMALRKVDFDLLLLLLLLLSFF